MTNPSELLEETLTAFQGHCGSVSHTFLPQLIHKIPRLKRSQPRSVLTLNRDRESLSFHSLTTLIAILVAQHGCVVQCRVWGETQRDSDETCPPSDHVLSHSVVINDVCVLASRFSWPGLSRPLGTQLHAVMFTGVVTSRRSRHAAATAARVFDDKTTPDGHPRRLACCGHYRKCHESPASDVPLVGAARIHREWKLHFDGCRHQTEVHGQLCVMRLDDPCA